MVVSKLSEGRPLKAPKRTMAHKKLTGTLSSFMFSPKGGIEGLLMETESGPVQVTAPVEMGGLLILSATVGQLIDLVVKEDAHIEGHPPGEHPVFRIVSFGAKEGERRLAIGLEEDAIENLSGRIESFNYARHGEANGFVLDSGDFVHVRPEGMRLLRLGIGDKVKAEGHIHPNLLGSLAVEASHVNGIFIGKKAKEIH